MDKKKMSGYTKNDEIDLMEIFSILWSKKWWIVLSAFVFTSIAGVYAFTAKEQWTSKAEVIAPKLSDLGDYFAVRKEYARILNLEFDYKALSDNLYGKFNLYTESLNKRKEFFTQSDLYKKMAENLPELSKKQLLSNLTTKHITIAKPDSKKEPNLIGRRISLFTENPESAQNTLRDFIIFNSKLAYKEEVDNFLISIHDTIKDLMYEKTKFERDLKIQKTIQLKNLAKALSIAKEAGIKDYIKSVNNNNDLIQNIVLSDGTYLFMLGEKYLQAQIDVVTNSEIVYPPRYYLVTELLRELEPLFEKTQKAQAQAFSYQASPDYPVAKDKPKKALILAIGLFIGLVLSSLIVLVFGFVNRKQ